MTLDQYIKSRGPLTPDEGMQAILRYLQHEQEWSDLDERLWGLYWYAWAKIPTSNRKLIRDWRRPN